MLNHEQYDDIVEVMICKEMHWTLDEVRNLSVEDRGKVEAILSGLAEGAKK